METSMKTESTTMELDDCRTLKERESDSISIIEMDINGKESDEAFSNENSKDGQLPDNVQVMPPGSDSGRSSNGSSSPLNFEIPENPVNAKADADIDHNLPSPKDVTYTATNGDLEAAGESGSASVGGDEDLDPNKIIYFVNQDAKITPSPVIQYIIDVDQPFDTVISCEDGKIGAHRLVLASASPFIADMLCSHDHRLGEVAVVILPDVKVSIMKVLLQFCYTGTMFFREEAEQEVMDTMKLLLLGEYGNLSIKKVTVKIEPVASTSAAAAASVEHFPEPEPRITRNVDDLPEPPSSTADSKSLDDLLSSSSENEKNDSEDDSSSSESEDERNPESYQTMHVINPDGAQERLAFANNFLRLVQSDKSEKKASIKYLLGPRQPGSKTKKIQCYLCPGAFKSMETLTNHLDNNHAESLQSRNLRKTEFETLTHCTKCDTKHKSISNANMCISKHSRTRCLICFKILRIRDFEEHIKEEHAEDRRNGICVVKCRWCDAGILLQEPIDNKAISAHCFSAHFPGKNENSSGFKFAKEEEKQKPQKIKVPPTPVPADVKPENLVKEKLTDENSKPLAFTPKQEDSKPSKSTGAEGSSSTPKASSSKVTTKQVPAVLALLQKASLKRKLMQEAENADLQNDKPKKRARTDANGKRLQVAKRTGKPIGRQLDINSLRTGIFQVPSSQTSQKSRGKAKSLCVNMDVTNLPNIFVQLKYPKTFVLESLGVITGNQESNPNESSHSTTSLASQELGMLDGKRRHSDSRCSLPLP